MHARPTQLILLLAAVMVFAGCASQSKAPTDGEAAETTDEVVEVSDEQARTVIERVASFSPANGANVAQRFVMLAAGPGDFDDTLPIGWTVTRKPSEKDTYRATLVWDTEPDGTVERRFDFVVTPDSVNPANDAARELIHETVSAPSDDIVIVPTTYDTESEKWTGSGAKLMSKLKARRRLDALAMVLNLPWLTDRMSAWMAARSIDANAVEACSDAKKCQWRVDSMNDEWMRVEYRSELDGMPVEVVWHVSQDRVLPGSPLAYVLETAGAPAAFEVPADRPLRAQLTSDAFHFEGRWLTDFHEGNKGGSTGLFAATDRWRDEIRLAVLLSTSHGVDKPVLEMETPPDERAFVFGIFTGIAFEQGVDRVRLDAGDGQMVTLPKLEHEDAQALDQDALILAVGNGAFRVARGGESLDPVDGCPADGPTVCPVGSKVGAERYDIRRLYNVLVKAHSNTDGAPAITGFDNDVPASVMSDVLWLLRTRLEGAPFDAAGKFEVARANKQAHGTLFDAVERAPYSVVYGESFSQDIPAKLTRAMVRDTIGGANDEIYSCGVESNPENLGGRMVVRFHVEMSGRVSTAEIISDEIRDTSLGNCIRDVFFDLKFPKTRSDIKISYPVVIK